MTPPALSPQPTLDALAPAPGAQPATPGCEANGSKSGNAGLAVGAGQRLFEIAGMFWHPTFRWVLLMSAAAQHGNALFATSLQATDPSLRPPVLTGHVSSLSPD
jgi:hypothetical protein